MPLEEDMPLAYQEYITHQDAAGAPSGAAYRLYRALLWTTGLARQRAALRSMYLAQVPPGRLLDVGCGNGAQLADLRTLGWEVEGQELDPKAVERARARYGLRVHLGTLQSLALPDEAYDAITMNHVIEHVHDPVALLSECRRILKPGGVLVATTPNMESLGHHLFASSWRGLDPPRHLHLFSQQSLRRVAQQAGFGSCRSWTTAARAVGSALGSLDIQRTGHHDIRSATRAPMGRKLRAALFQLQAGLVHLAQPGSGEECVLQARP
jgi:2-polyprenyl-3-methyl-5-hydroxy-6-metoxy-1,4-benzoquinol methylase